MKAFIALVKGGFRVGEKNDVRVDSDHSHRVIWNSDSSVTLDYISVKIWLNSCNFEQFQ